MNELEQYQERIFEEIRHVDEEGREFWYARELRCSVLSFLFFLRTFGQ